MQFLLFVVISLLSGHKALVFALLPSYLPEPNLLIHQIIPPGQPWPMNVDGYTDSSEGTQNPITPPILVTDRINGENQPSSEEEFPPVSIVAQQTTSTTKKDFNRDPWDGITSTEDYWLGSVQELPYL